MSEDRILEGIGDRDESLDYFGELNKEKGVLSPEYLHRLEESKWFYKYKHKMLIEILKKSDLDFEDKIITDIGVGTGKLSKELEQFGEIDYRFDSSKEYKRYAEEEFNLEIEEGSLPYKIELKESNIVYLLDVLEYLIVPGLSLNVIYNHLKEGGYLVLTTVFHNYLHSEVNKQNGVVKRYSKRYLDQMLRGYGFEIKYFSYLDYEVFRLAILKNLTKEGLVYPVTKLREKEKENKLYKESMFDLLRIKNNQELPYGRGGVYICQKIEQTEEEQKEAKKKLEGEQWKNDEAKLLDSKYLERVIERFFKLDGLEDQEDKDTINKEKGGKDE